MAVSESRVSQLLDQAMRFQEKGMASEDSRQKKSAQQPEKPRALSQQIQARPSFYAKANQLMESTRGEKGSGLEQKKDEEKEIVFGAFGVESF